MTIDNPSLLPEGDPPKVAPLWRPLLVNPCSACGSARLFPQLAEQGPMIALQSERIEGVSLPLWPAWLKITVLCGDCGQIDERTHYND